MSANLMVSACLCCARVAEAQEVESPPLASPIQATAIGLQAGNWLVRARVAGVFPVDETSVIEPIGGRIETPRMLLPDLQIAWFLTEHISLEGQGGVVRTRPRIRDSIIGDFKIGTIGSAAAAASLQYHVLPGRRINPYIGAGVSYSHPIWTEPADGISDFKVKSQMSVMLQAGVDRQLGANWFSNAVVKYLLVPEQVYESGSARFTSGMDMVLVGAGIGYRF
ncbi:OmpW family outer membrane protein [Sphingomonas sp. PP-CE-1G-424]|uniref:OmpW/AlkL family protein n=1 Tax=Sphingomonas sp. PP-CE-1G-424 TaxID=2135658 RepID=UPI0010D89726|nr:OmpW family outer membrane protein [Sphingomonas sp. PP-CE-1G-424]TCP65571.1 outer membrane protein [Sphingomonas sp. PP-CE-1G-424]